MVMGHVIQYVENSGGSTSRNDDKLSQSFHIETESMRPESHSSRQSILVNLQLLDLLSLHDFHAFCELLQNNVIQV